MVVLTDDQADPNYRPTKQNIVNAMRWLVGGAQPGDSLFFHFSGHGGQVKDRNGDEVDGMDDVIYPVDHSNTGPLIDDEMHEIMLRYLPPGVRFTAIFDCCHSGTGLDLPYVYNSDGTLKKYNPAKAVAQTVLNAGKDLLRPGGTFKAVTGLFNGVNSLLSGGGQAAEQRTQQTRSTQAEVVMFSGCKDSQTSADTFISGVGSTGAMSFAFIKAMSVNGGQHSYLTLLQNVRVILQQQYSQKPQLSTGHPMDMNRPFFM